MENHRIAYESIYNLAGIFFNRLVELFLLVFTLPIGSLVPAFAIGAIRAICCGGSTTVDFTLFSAVASFDLLCTLLVHHDLAVIFHGFNVRLLIINS